MAKQNILIVDSDPESVKVLEVSLKKAGYSVTKSPDGLDALEMIGFSAPDLIISDTKMPSLDGFGLCTKLKESEETAHIPFIFLTSEKSIEDKIRGLELGVEDYLNKPIFIREILVRVNLALQRRQKEHLENRAPDNKSKFSGSLQDMGVVDLLQTIDLGHKSGVIHLTKSDDAGDIFFRDGQVIDAKTTTRKGADAVYRMLVWSEGEFEIEFMGVDRKQEISLNTQGLLMEGMRRLDEWGRLQEQLPPLTSIFDVDEEILAERLGEIPDEVNTILRHFDGRSPLMEVVNRSGMGDLEALTVITKLFFEGLILEVPPMPTIPAPAETEALLSDETLTSEPPSSPLVPSRVVDDAIGPHLSVAASNPLGFVNALTQSAPPTAPALAPDPGQDEMMTNPSIEPGKLASLAQRNVQDDAVQKIEIAKIESPPVQPPIPEVENDHETMIGVVPPKPTEGDSQTAAFDKRDAPDPRRTRTLTSRDSLTAGDIAAAIDAELPPPPEEVTEDSTSTEISGYFEGAAYKASFNARPSYEPPSDAEEDAGTEASELSPAEQAPATETEPEAEERAYSEAENGATEDEALEDELWEDDPEDEPSMPSNLKPLLAIVAVLLLSGVIGGVWFFLSDTENIDAGAGSKSSAAKDTVAAKEAVAAQPLVVKTNGKIAPQNPLPNTQPPASATPSEKDTADSAAGKTAPDSPPDVPLSTGAASAPEAAEAKTPPPPAKKTLTAEEKTKIKKLMAESERSGKKRKTILFKEVLAIDPTNDEALSLLAIELLERKQTRDEANDLAKQAIAVNADNAMAWLAVGYIHQLNGDQDAAKEAYSRCARCSGPGKYVRECRQLAR